MPNPKKTKKPITVDAKKLEGLITETVDAITKPPKGTLALAGKTFTVGVSRRVIVTVTIEDIIDQDLDMPDSTCCVTNLPD